MANLRLLSRFAFGGTFHLCFPSLLTTGLALVGKCRPSEISLEDRNRAPPTLHCLPQPCATARATGTCVVKSRPGHSAARLSVAGLTAVLCPPTSDPESRPSQSVKPFFLSLVLQLTFLCLSSNEAVQCQLSRLEHAARAPPDTAIGSDPANRRRPGASPASPADASLSLLSTAKLGKREMASASDFGSKSAGEVTLANRVLCLLSLFTDLQVNTVLLSASCRAPVCLVRAYRA